MNVVDSSAWLEYFADGPNASFFAASIVYGHHKPDTSSEIARGRYLGSPPMR
jgi:hypothetical protein